jgi:hypothetical protein
MAENYESFLEFSAIALLCIAVLLPIIVYLMLMARLNKLRKEKDRDLAKLREQLQLKMEIDSDAESTRRKKIDQLQKENENLRIKVQEYRNKPRRDSERQAQIYERALAIMHERAPGFSGAWQRAYQDAESEMVDSEKGLLNFAKRTLLPGSSAGSSSRHALEDREGDSGGNGSRHREDEDVEVR